MRKNGCIKIIKNIASISVMNFHKTCPRSRLLDVVQEKQEYKRELAHVFRTIFEKDNSDCAYLLSK